MLVFDGGDGQRRHSMVMVAMAFNGGGSVWRGLTGFDGDGN